MKTTHRRVLVTGATGTWGLATLDVLLDQGLSVLALVLPSPGDLDKIAPFLGRRGLQVIYGDVRDANLLKRLVTQVDVILHLAAVISPLADEQPEVTRQVNVGGARNVIAAVRSLPDPSVVDVVMCGSVAEYGDRLPPVHWARVGDPLAPSQFDHYGQSKVAAERLLVESGLPRWIWLRQTGILHAGLVNTRDPIITHSPLAGVLEWTSDVNSAHLLAQLASETTPDELWGRVHNIGDGAGWRFTNFELQQHLLDTLQVFDQRKWFERRWFATKNFHGVWYTDSQRLQQLVPYRVETFDEALRRCAQQAGALSRLAHLVPSWIVRRCIMRPQVYRSPRGTMSWVRDDNTDYLAAFFGSRQEWERIGSWDTFVPVEPSPVPQELEHGFDSSVAHQAWTDNMLRQVAAFRGGALLSDSMRRVNWAARLTWRCSVGHRFEASPRLILHAGHWCPICVTSPRDYPDQAGHNRFLAQVVTPLVDSS